MIASARILAIAAISALVLAALPTSTDGWFMGLIEAMVPELLDLVPDVCKEDDNSEFQLAVGCAFDKLDECIDIITALPELEEIPSMIADMDNITECFDIQEPFCAIAGNCLPCIGEFDTLIRCMVLNDPMLVVDIIESFENVTIGENVTDMDLNATDLLDLLDSCDLDVC